MSTEEPTGAPSSDSPETSAEPTQNNSDFESPYPGSKQMPQWETGELVDAPKFGMKNWAMMLGPGLILGGAAIGGGEWLTGPMVTARYGGALLWLATLSILGQVIYNIEISRYTLYSGEPIFTGKFRIPPGPTFWVITYLILDFGSFFPYLAAFAATPLLAAFIGGTPDVDNGMLWGYTHVEILRFFSICIFLGAMIPLIFGGKVFNMLKWIMGFKIIAVMSFLLVVGFCFTKSDTWVEIFSGFFKFGNIPIERVEDLNNNGILDEGEDWDSDGHLDVIEPKTDYVFYQNEATSEKRDATDIDRNGVADPMVEKSIPSAKEGEEPTTVWWPDLNEDGEPDKTVALDINGDGQPDGEYLLDKDENGHIDAYIDIDGDGTRDGDNVDNLFSAAVGGRSLPPIDWTIVGFLSALIAISGSGGLSNTPISNYTRDQGWGMGHHVGAIPSLVGGQNIELSHVGVVFEPTAESMPRWKRWYRHILRDQVVVWMPACFFGLALPSMLSVEFLDRGTVVADQWTAAVMTADGVEARVASDWGTSWGDVFGFMTLFCGFLVLAPSMSASADGVIRRWVDVFWTSSKRLRAMDPKAIRYVYFVVLTVFTIMGLIMLNLNKPVELLLIATTIYNFALGISCLHALAVNVFLLPEELRPNWFVRIALGLTGLFFLMVASLSTYVKFM